MSALEIILTTMVVLFFILTILDDRAAKRREVDLVNKWSEAEKETNNWIESYGALQKNFNELNKIHQATKAELDTYKNHQSET